MNKRSNLAFLTLFIVGLFSLFTTGVFAQTTESLQTEQKPKTCSGEKFVMPPAITVGTEAFDNYLQVAALSGDERKKAFGRLSNEQKASFIRVNLALQFVKRPNMTREQREFVLDAISKVSADIYDKSNSEKVRLSEQSAGEMINKAFALFPRKDAGDFVEPLNTNKNEEIALLQKYDDLLKNGMLLRMKIAKEMPVNERVNIWKVQLAYHLATGKFSKSQNKFILEMLVSLSPETFAPRTNSTTEEESKNAAVMLLRIFTVFTKAEGFAIFMTVGIQKQVKDAPVDTNEMQSPTCQCLANCSFENQTCAEVPCVSTPDGCGPWGMLGCHYMCVTGPPVLDISN